MSSSIGSQTMRDYDFTKSTKDNYTQASHSDAPEFCGDFKEIRQHVDSRWHGSYVCSRQLLQDNLIKEILGLDRRECLSEKEESGPWIVFTGGAMGAGKSYTMNWMMRMGIIPIPKLRHIDPDVFKRKLPEWNYYVKLNATTAGSLTHLESSMLVEIAQEVALQRRMNVWIDGSLSNYDWTVSQLRRIRGNFPNYRIAVVHVSASETAIMERCERRAKATGRVVPVEKIRNSLHASVRTVQALSHPLVDFVAMVRNEGAQPELVSINHQPVESNRWEYLSELLRKT